MPQNPSNYGRFTVPAAVREKEREYVAQRRGAAKVGDESHKQPLVGIALSGGGIRSATFSLGILQVLARARTLPIVDYLCTVSGGGYIGSCLTSLMTRWGCYICDACGEEIVIPIDPSAGSSQEYVEDCPVCCNPTLIHVEIDETGDVRVRGQAEQDRY